MKNKSLWCHWLKFEGMIEETDERILESRGMIFLHPADEVNDILESFCAYLEENIEYQDKN